MNENTSSAVCRYGKRASIFWRRKWNESKGVNRARISPSTNGSTVVKHENFSFWWNHTRSGSPPCVAPVSSSGASLSRYKPPEGSPEGVPFSERRPPAERSEPAVPPSEARLHRGDRAKRGSTEAPPTARRSSGGRHYKKTQKGSTRKPRGTTYCSSANEWDPNS